MGPVVCALQIEAPKGGDPIRKWRELDTDGTSPWWRSIGRNKKSVTIDLRQPGGRDLARKLATKADVLVFATLPHLRLVAATHALDCPAHLPSPLPPGFATAG